MMTSEEKLASLREEMVNRQLFARGINDQEILSAFRATPREKFVPAQYATEAYSDCPVPIGYGQTISQPYVVALMIQELDVNKEHRVLEIGVGSGYQTAILARLAKYVYAMERIDCLTERAIGTLAGLNVNNVTTCTLDGTLGWPEEAPFDRIICGAAAPNIPQPWIDQLADDGRIIAPIGSEQHQTLVTVEKIGGEIRRREICGVRFVKLIGRHGWKDQTISAL